MRRLYPCRSLLAMACEIKKEPGLFYLGAVLAILHFIYVAKIVIWIGTASGAELGQCQMVWCEPGYIDFPISLVVGMFLQLPFDIDIDILSILPYEMGSLTLFWIPALFHGIIGTLFYFLLPTLIWKTAKWLSQINRNAFVHVILLIVPILCAVSAFTNLPKKILPPPFNTELWIQSGWIVLWLLLLIYVIFTQRHHRRRALFHFVLLPFVLWFPARAVMFEVIANRELYNLYDNMFVSFLLCYP